MILSFADKGTQAVFDGADPKLARETLPSHLHRVAGRRLAALDAAESLDELRAPGYHLVPRLPNINPAFDPSVQRHQGPVWLKKVGRAENPEKMLNQIIIDMRDQLAKAKRNVASSIADERKLRSQLDDEIKQSRDWEHRAMPGIKEGRDDLSEQALTRQQEHAERAAAIDATWRAQSTETEKLKSSLRRLNDKIEEAKRKRNLLIAEQKRAQAQRPILETMSGLSDTSAFEAFNRMAEQIEEKESHRQSSAWTVRIDGQYRIAFKWTEDGVEDVEIINCR